MCNLPDLCPHCEQHDADSICDECARPHCQFCLSDHDGEMICPACE